MAELSRAGIRVQVPPGWEGAATGGDFELLSDGARRPTVMHLASFPMPAQRGDFGSGAVEVMRSDDVLVVLFEYGPESAGTPLFRYQGIPRPLAARDFDRNALQRALPGQSGAQLFFTEKGRAFCLYVVLGSHIDRADLVRRVNLVLDTLEIDG